MTYLFSNYPSDFLHFAKVAYTKKGGLACQVVIFSLDSYIRLDQVRPARLRYLLPETDDTASKLTTSLGFPRQSQRITMKLLTILTAFCVTALAATSNMIDSTIVSIQPISASQDTPVTTLAEIKYNPSTLSAEILSFNPPDLSSSPSSLLRIGIFDPITGTWKSSTSTTSADTFKKGYKPTIVVTLGNEGAVLSVSVKGARIDAGATRDFAPKVLVRGIQKTRGPELNRPVVLSAEGKVATPEVEKTMLQKYW